MKKIFVGILIALLTIPANAEPAASTSTITISGTVRDDTETLVGATVFACYDACTGPYDNVGTITDMDGNFSLAGVPSNAKIKISYVGLDPQILDPRAAMGTITLKSNNSLQEVEIKSEFKSTPCSAEQLAAVHAASGMTRRAPSGNGVICVPEKCAFAYKLTNGACVELNCVGPRYILNEKGTDCEDQVGKKCTPDTPNATDGKYIWENEKLRCEVTKCAKGYTPNDPKNDQCEASERPCTDAELKSIPHATAGEYKNGKCRASECASGFSPRKGVCEEKGRPCTDAELKSVPHATAGEYRDGKCLAEKCDDGYDPQDGACILVSKCSDMPDGAASGHNETDASGKIICVIDSCKSGYKFNADQTKCLKEMLSEEESKKKIEELEQNVKNMKDKEQSDANKLLGASAMAMTGIGGMQALSGLAEKNADADAERDMAAYLATFRCDYGGGAIVKGGETAIILPGANTLAPLYQEYTTLADDLKERKAALGLRPGIEAEVVIDKAASGLYDDVGTGITNGTYASVARALMDENSADAAAWNAQKDDAAKKLKTGAILAGTGVVGGIAGNLIINRKAEKENSAEINEKYNKLKRVFDDVQPKLDTQPAQSCRDFTGTTGTGTAPNCTCQNATNEIFSTDKGCTPCPGNQVVKNGECGCPDNLPDLVNGTCTARRTAGCVLTGVVTNATSANCTCAENTTKNGNECRCATGYTETDGKCERTTTPVTPSGQPIASFTIPASTTFKSGSATLTDSGRTILASITDELKKQNVSLNDVDYCVTITGHTDRTGFRGSTAAQSKQKNLTLSQQRADAVKKLLSDNGVFDAAKINATGRGDADCARATYPRANEERCRRVDVKVTTGTCDAGGTGGAIQGLIKGVTQKLPTEMSTNSITNLLSAATPVAAQSSYGTAAGRGGPAR